MAKTASASLAWTSLESMEGLWPTRGLTPGSRKLFIFGRSTILEDRFAREGARLGQDGEALSSKEGGVIGSICRSRPRVSRLGAPPRDVGGLRLPMQPVDGSLDLSPGYRRLGEGDAALEKAVFCVGVNAVF